MIVILTQRWSQPKTVIKESFEDMHSKNSNAFFQVSFMSATYVETIWFPLLRMPSSLVNHNLTKTLPERIYNSHYGNGVPAMFTS